MNPFDLGNLGGLFGGLQQRVEAMKRRTAELRVTGRAGGGAVTVEMAGTFEITAVHISAEAAQDREILEDLVRAATNDATRQVKDAVAAGMSELTGGLPIPPGLFPGLG